MFFIFGYQGAGDEGSRRSSLLQRHSLLVALKILGRYSRDLEQSFLLAHWAKGSATRGIAVN